MYILYSPSFRQNYVGHTDNLQNRFTRHNKGLVPSTKRYKPWEMIHTEIFSTRAEAMKREKYLKSGVGRKEVKEIIEQYLL